MDGHILAWTSATEAIKSNLHCLLTKALLLASYLIPPHPLSPSTHPTLTAALTGTMPSTEAIGNKDNYIKQPFEIPLGFGWLVRFGSGLGDEGGLMHCLALCNGQDDITSLRS